MVNVLDDVFGLPVTSGAAASVTLLLRSVSGPQPISL